MDIDGNSLTLADVVRIARRNSTGEWDNSFTLTNAAKMRLRRARDYVENKWLADECPSIYGFNTGVGRLLAWRVPVDRMNEFQSRLVNSHCAGTGGPLPEDVVRASMLLRVNSNAQGHSGIRLETAERILVMLKAGIHPLIPSKGSVGASGDLAPLAYLAEAVMGHPTAQVIYNGIVCPARVAFEKEGLPPAFPLEAKEALAILNGSTISLAIAILAAHDAQLCISTAEVALAMTLEALRGELAAFDPRIHAVRPHRGQIVTAQNVLAIIEGSKRCSHEAQSIALSGDALNLPMKPRIQDAYSLRCAPQVHGPARDALEYVRSILAVEINSATDNPLMFATNDDYTSFEALSGGNFHGQYIAQTTDLLGIAMTDLGSISERRASRLLDPSLSHGLPINLIVREPGLNTGFAIAQCTMAALVSENKTLCWPASVDSIPTKGNQEDHVSNSTWCARKAALIVDNVLDILSIEILMSTQALALTDEALGGFPMGKGTAAAYALVRRTVEPMLDGDRRLHDDIHAVQRLVRSGEIVEAVHAVLSGGPLS